MNNLFKHNISTEKSQSMVNITNIINSDLKKTGIQDGVVLVFSPHTTAGITINENADPDVVKDLLYGFEKVYPTNDKNYKHFEGNSHSHLKSSTIGSFQNIIIVDGKLLLGVWQCIYFCDFDGPRNRTFYVKIIEC